MEPNSWPVPPKSPRRYGPPAYTQPTTQKRNATKPPWPPRKSGPRGRSSAWSLPASKALPTPPSAHLPTAYSETQRAIQRPSHNDAGLDVDATLARSAVLAGKPAYDQRVVLHGRESNLPDSPSIYLEKDPETDKSSEYSRMSTAYSFFMKEPSSSVTSFSSLSHSSNRGSDQRLSAATWIQHGALELGTESDTALPEYQIPILPQAAPGTSGISFTPSEILFMITVCLAQFLSLAGLAQTFAPLMILSEAFNVSNPGLMAWPTAAYSLTLGSCILPSGRLGDMFGHRKIFLTGWIWFASTSLLCGFSSVGGSPMFIACRAFQGVGPALLIPNGLALFGRTFPIGMKRNIAISFFGGSGPLGVVTGAVMSSLLSELLWWPWSFWTMGIFCFFVAALTFVAVPVDNIKANTDPKAGTRREFDLLGALTGVGGLILINFALNQAPIDSWKSVYIGVLLVVGVLLMCAFVYIELRVAESPLIPLKGLHREAALTLSCIAAGWGSHGIWSYYLFLLLEQLRGHSALEACSMFWPVAPIGLTAALSVGLLLKKIKVAYLMSISMLCFLLACLFLATAPGQQGYFPNTFLSIVIAPFGMNYSFPTGVILMSNAVPREHQGIAASLVSTMVNYSISTGLGFAGSIDRHIGPEYGLLAGYRSAWYFGIGLSALGFLISLYFIWQSRKSTR